MHTTESAVNYTQIILYHLSLLLMSVKATLGHTIMLLVRCRHDMNLLLTGRVAYNSHVNLLPKFILLSPMNPVTFSDFSFQFGFWS
jgi:hypothetical protein